MKVRVSTAVVGATNAPVTRIVELFTNISYAESFLGARKDIVSNQTTNTTNNSNQSTSVNSINANIKNVPAGGTNTGIVKNEQELKNYIHNGNQNVYALKGNLVVQCDTASGKNSFEMTGVKTVLVEGNITFECNTSYPSDDTTSSWAWIAKNGSIKIFNGTNATTDKGITNLAGVYVAIKESAPNSGLITYSGQATTTAILRIDGTLYGDATTLFNSRTYARGTSAHEILTTGTILSYSNRALVTPPPLLSQYLNNYKVQRVVK